MRNKIIRAILVSLLQYGDQPMPEDALITASQLLCRPLELTDDDITDVMKDLASGGYISGATDELTKERFWKLTTPKGLMKAREMK